MARVRSSGIPGLAVLLAAAGGYLVYVGVRNVEPLDGLRTLLRGSLPEGRAPSPGRGGGNSPGGTVTGGGGLGGRIAAEASKYEGVPYRWGGNTTAGWDCSGFVNHVLRRVGVALPNGRPTTVTYAVWRGAVNVPRASAQAGDLVVYPGHMGIALSNTHMIHAPTFGKPTQKARIYGTPTIRRVKG